MNGDSGTSNGLDFRLLPGLDGVPFRMPAGSSLPNLKEDDPEHLRPTEVCDAHVKIFDLSVPEQLKEYGEILDDAAKGKVLLSMERVEYVEKDVKFVVLLRWLTRYLEIPKGRVEHYADNISYR